MPFRILCSWILGILLAACAVVVRLSVMTTSVRVLLVSTMIFCIFTGVVHLVRMFEFKPKMLFPVFFFLCLFVLWGVLGNKPPDVPLLRGEYIKRLNVFEGSRYLLGGETSGGIDCSGLARSALWQAMLLEGVREVNPHLLGMKFWRFWWRDISASDILHCKYGYTKAIGTAPKLAGYDTSDLKPGDLAVASGIHVMIYVGDGKWIESSPGDKKVVTNKASASSKRGWFNVPVTLMRWWILEDK
ncbi:C40 family peptidase [bacterium]|nr:C40 family peptidase [bacterium]